MCSSDPDRGRRGENKERQGEDEMKKDMQLFLQLSFFLMKCKSNSHMKEAVIA